MSVQHILAKSAAESLTRAYLRDEAALVNDLMGQINLSDADRNQIRSTAKDIVNHVRADESATSTIDDLLLEYGLSSDEGVTLMRLAEALIRTPDFATSRSLIRDKIGGADWSAHTGKSESFLVNQATNGLRLTAAWVSGTKGPRAQNLLAKLGDQVMEHAVERAMGIMGDHFVHGRSITQALKRARKNEAAGFTYSYDMLGEAAHTMADADTYFEAYLNAMKKLAANDAAQNDMAKSAGLSVKLSALHPRYEYAHRDTCVPILVDRVLQLATIAKDAGLWLNIDAEEADRLEISLIIFEKLLQQPSLKDWPGLGLVVQAYQRRAMQVISHLTDLTQSTHRKIAVRLVKGAYWDMEIKRAQELGLTSYPVFTRKENTDVSYLACAGRLLEANETIFPQFATHNAHTAAAIAHMAGPDGDYEFQRLHGMGEALHTKLMTEFGAPSRIYAPVGTHKDLLPYLVRRLLENGANSSFVNQLMDERVAVDEIVMDPISEAAGNDTHAHNLIPSPTDILEGKRLSAKGMDLTQSDIAAEFTSIARRSTSHSAASQVGDATPPSQKSIQLVSPQDKRQIVGDVAYAAPELVDEAVQAANASSWANDTSPSQKAAILQTAANLLESEMGDFLELCVREAGKTLPDAVAEVREAVDFCRYYALQAQRDVVIARQPLGTVACISPWNFPLAIFLGQITAALSVGNTVIAKPAEQTPLIAAKAVDLLYRAGIPKSALHLMIGNGAELGNALTRHNDITGVCFTGSTRTAKIIAGNLADTGRATVPFIAETGGLNAMIVDSTALLEQAVQDVVDSAFQSAGQRCSACRIVCVQEDIYAPFTRMLTGAMDALVIGDPASLATDVGPVIDDAARQMIEAYKAEKRDSGAVLKECTLPATTEHGHFTAPILLEMTNISEIDREIFGPVLHLVKFKSKEIGKLVDGINQLGYGLTMGLHTRLDSRIEDISTAAHVGNLYVNRNQIGAVVGVQPFGGEGLSGTGPKAGGPHYLFGLTKSSAQTAPAITPPLQATKLPGPTGEENTLRLFPKGSILCFGGGESDALYAQLSLALTAGSTAIVVRRSDGADDTSEIKNRLEADGFASDRISYVSFEEGLSLINGTVDSIVADGAVRDKIGPHVCRRDGPILPVLSSHDPIERFFHERTLTINTTAAGGNASLLALG